MSKEDKKATVYNIEDYRRKSDKGALSASGIRENSDSWVEVIEDFFKTDSVKVSQGNVHDIGLEKMLDEVYDCITLAEVARQASRIIKYHAQNGAHYETLSSALEGIEICEGRAVEISEGEDDECRWALYKAINSAELRHDSGAISGIMTAAYLQNPYVAADVWDYVRENMQSKLGEEDSLEFMYFGVMILGKLPRGRSRILKIAASEFDEFEIFLYKVSEFAKKCRHIPTIKLMETAQKKHEGMDFDSDIETADYLKEMQRFLDKKWKLEPEHF